MHVAQIAGQGSKKAQLIVQPYQRDLHAAAAVSGSARSVTACSLGKMGTKTRLQLPGIAARRWHWRDG